MKKIMMMMVLMLGLNAFSALPVSWDVKLNSSSYSAVTAPFDIEVYSGEKISLEPRYLNRGKPFEIDSEAFIRCYMRESGTDSEFIASDAVGVVYTTTSDKGRVSIEIIPSDYPAITNDFYIGLNDSGLNYKAHGQIIILPGPGVNPVQTSISRITIDWSSVDNINISQFPYFPNVSEELETLNTVLTTQYLPYTGANSNLDMGIYSIDVTDLLVNGDSDFEGAVTFNSTASVQTPTLANHPTTKDYVDTEITTADADNVESTSIANIWTGTQAEYDALTPDANTLYFIEEE